VVEEILDYTFLRGYAKNPNLGKDGGSVDLAGDATRKKIIGWTYTD